jgi:hypothetical protein
VRPDELPPILCFFCDAWASSALALILTAIRAPHRYCFVCCMTLGAHLSASLVVFLVVRLSGLPVEQSSDAQLPDRRS